MCVACAKTLDAVRLERRRSESGEEVRVSGNLTWGSMPDDATGPVLVCVDVTSNWFDVASEEGRGLLQATARRR